MCTMKVDSCRVCLSKTKKLANLRSIFKRNTEVSYLEAFNTCTNLDAFLGDQLPQHLCTVCSQELETCYELLVRAKETDVKLRQALNTPKNKSQELLVESNYAETNVDFTKDPLEESDEEEYDYSKEPLTYEGSDDEDDNKPLKVLFNEAAKSKTENVNEDEKPYELSNEQYAVPDDAFSQSTEAQIFPQGRFRCNTCNKAYFTTVGLEAHLEVHLPKSATTKKKRIRCPNKSKRKISDVAAVQADELKTEQKTEGEESKQAEEEADRHEIKQSRKAKLPKPKKMFPCHVCGKHMISASKLRYHMVMHTGEKNYLCTMCPKAYSTIYALKHHIRTHTGERPYECKFCGDKFLRPTTLKSHMRRHTGERPYGCDICGKRFIQHSSMTTHMKLNHMAKTIPCPHCDKKYARQTDLNTHILSHTGDKPFSCQQCPSRFIRQANLNKHMNQHHTTAKSNETKASKTDRRATFKNNTTSIKDENLQEVGESGFMSTTSAEQLAIAANTNTISNAPAIAKQDTQHLEAGNMVLPTLFHSTNDCDITCNTSTHIKHTLPTIVASQRQDQHFVAESARSFSDLNRWNWPSLS